MKRKKRILSPKEVLKEFQAILALEEEAARAYHQLSEDCDDGEAKRILEKTSREERAHAKIAKKLVEIARAALNAHPRKTP